MNDPTDSEWVADLFRSADEPETDPPAAVEPNEDAPPQDDNTFVHALFQTADPKKEDS
jgi:hypothetical protein